MSGLKIFLEILDGSRVYGEKSGKKKNILSDRGLVHENVRVGKIVLHGNSLLDWVY